MKVAGKNMNKILSYYHRVFLSVQWISSIGQIIKLLCLCVSQSVSQRVCHTKRVECSTSIDRSPPPIFTKLATKVESREVHVVTYCFGGNPKEACPPNRKWN